jgi:uncharacterized protein YbaP (TraB family)
MALAAALLLALLLAPRPAAAAEPACPPAAGVPTPEQIRQAMQSARDRGALWRFTKDGRDGYLYGTIHVGKREWAMPGRAVFGALRDAETVVLEADPLDKAFRAGVTAPAAPHEAPPLPAPLARRLREQARRTCASWDRLRTMPPMMIAATLALLDAAWEGLHAEYASEMVLAGYARGAGKPLTALETSAIQRAAINGGPPVEQLASVEALLTGLEQGTARKEVVAAAEAWARGDLDGLRRSLVDANPAERASVERLIAPRNGPMAARIDALHAGGQRLFVAVGIMHMVGDAGLPRLLRERGFTVERVQFDERVGLEVGGVEGNPPRVPLPKE